VVTNALTLSLIFHRFAGPVVHIGAMSMLACGLLIAGLVQLRSVLAPFRQLQRRLAAVREGSSPRIEGDFPSAVTPVITDLNALLDHRAQLVQRAVAKAGDLAHGLKTPLAVLGQESERLSAAGQHEGAAIVAQQVERMRRQIDYHLAQARAAARELALATEQALFPEPARLVHERSCGRVQLGDVSSAVGEHDAPREVALGGLPPVDEEARAEYRRHTGEDLPPDTGAIPPRIFAWFADPANTPSINPAD
jgi:signal transduction histidine kinase